MVWGIVSDIVHAAEPYRRCFGSKRYAICGAKKVLCSCRKIRYRAEIFYQADESLEDQKILENSSTETSDLEFGKPLLENTRGLENWTEIKKAQGMLFLGIFAHEMRNSASKE